MSVKEDYTPVSVEAYKDSVRAWFSGDFSALAIRYFISEL